MHIKKTLAIGLKTLSIGEMTIQNALSCAWNWNEFYNNKPPWKKWFTNPIYQNKSKDLGDGNRRNWIIILGQMIMW